MSPIHATGDDAVNARITSTPIEEFLYMDPDTGMVVCMIADQDGFRPATAFDELASVELSRLYDQRPDGSPIYSQRGVDFGEENRSLDHFVKSYEHAFVESFAG